MIRTIEHALPDHIRLGALAAFPDAAWDGWHRYAGGKLGLRSRADLPVQCELALSMLACRIDPSEGFWDVQTLSGAGLHMMPARTSLGLHIDAERHQTRPWRRTGSMVYFLEHGSGGELVVDGEVIPAEANKAVIFCGQQPHAVHETLRDRKTLCLFSYVLDVHFQGDRTAYFYDNKKPASRTTD